VHIHRGDALPPGHRDSIFVCESAQNLVQRQLRSVDGVTFTSRPAQTGRDFLSSRDTWFRPVFAANGPDGALYIVDMYRKIIDHPQYVPEQSRALLDFQAGKERGRIYRIAARGWKRDRQPIDLGRMSTDQLSRTLEHSNAWRRETAQRLLVARRDRTATPRLRALAREGRTEVARLHALWTLDGLGGLEAADVVRALDDPHPAVRENAVRLAEPRMSASPELVAGVIRLVDDGEARVRFRVGLALGETDDPRTIGALAAIAGRDGAQSWMRAAVLSSVRNRTNELLRTFVATSAASPGARAAVMQDLGQLFGAGQPPERCLDLILQITEPGEESGWQATTLSGIARGLRSRGLGDQDRSALMTLVSGESPQSRSARPRLERVLSRASSMALDDTTPADQRLAAIELLGHSDYATAGRALGDLLAPRHPFEVQVAAVRALSQLPDPVAVASLLEPGRWPAFTPRIREAVLSALLADERKTPVLLDALERGAVTSLAVGASRRSRLMTHRDAAIQTRARALFAAVESGDRMQVYERARGTVPGRATDALRGRRVFATTCAACHAVDGAGGQVGPDLSGIRHQPADAILLHTLVPDYEITPGYQAYVVETRDGRTLVGRLESEAPNSLTLRDGAAERRVILRSDVISMSASAHSLMPAELERTMSEQDLADLIGYLKADPRPR
jgi:putative heme-binding domain-containing protein